MAFAADGEFAAIEVDVVAIEIDQFRDAQAGAKKQIDDGAIAQIGGGIFGNLVEDAFDFINVEEGNLAAGGFWEVDEGGVEGFDVAVS